MTEPAYKEVLAWIKAASDDELDEIADLETLPLDGAA